MYNAIFKIAKKSITIVTDFFRPGRAQYYDKKIINFLLRGIT